MDERELLERKKRHKRRVRNQIIAYAVFLCFLLCIIVGGYHGVRWIIRSVSEYNQKVEDALNSIPEPEPTQVATTGDELSETVSSQEPEPIQDPLDELVDALLADMTLEEKVAGMFIVTPEAITGVTKAIQAKEGTKKALEENPVGGILYSEQNYKSDDQFGQMISDTRSYSKYPLFIAVQREVGKSKAFGINATPQAIELTNVDDVTNAYTEIAQKLRSFGVNMNFAPVADVVSQEGNKSLQGRTFGSDAMTASPLVNAVVATLQGEEISAVLQRFPGEGTMENGQISKSLEELRNSEFITYKNAIDYGVDCVMVSNAKASLITGDEMPCSISRTVITEVLRQELGFNGVVITAAQNSKDITGTLSSKDAAVLAIMAGADMILCPADYKEAYNGVLEAVSAGTLTPERIDESLRRIYKIKYKNIDFGS